MLEHFLLKKFKSGYFIATPRKTFSTRYNEVASNLTDNQSHVWTATFKNNSPDIYLFCSKRINTVRKCSDIDILNIC